MSGGEILPFKQSESSSDRSIEHVRAGLNLIIDYVSVSDFKGIDQSEVAAIQTHLLDALKLVEQQFD